MSKNRRFDNTQQQDQVEVTNEVTETVVPEPVKEEVVKAPEPKKEPSQPKKGLQSVFNIELTLQSYLEAMNPAKPISEEEGGKWQYSLYQAIMAMLSVEPQEDFNETLKAFLRIVKENRKGVFSENFLFRFPWTFPGGPEEWNKYRYLLNLFILTCDPAKRSAGLDNVLMDKTLEPLTETQKNSLINFYNR